MNKKKIDKAWVVTVDMGYGHQRASYPLRFMAEGDIISANNYPGIPPKDKKLWAQSRKFYEFISRFKKVPLLGPKAFDLFDKFQSIPRFYPRRDLSKANVQLKEIYSLFEHQDWGRHLIVKLAQKPLPLVTTFFVTAMMAEYFKYPGEIFCVATDTDVSRTWVSLDPKNSKIIYLAPNVRVVERLKLYGVRPGKIFLTGFPLPLENTGRTMSAVKHDVGRRLVNLDPNSAFVSVYEKSLRDQLGKRNLMKKPSRPVTITFSVGGAGAQRDIGQAIVSSLKEEILAGRVNVNLAAGNNLEVFRFFKQAVKGLGLDQDPKSGVKIIFAKDKMEYFRQFDAALRNTDVLWTKPSELSFYCALGLPIIMAPPIGSQEIFNQTWLRTIGAGIDQEDPRYVNEWLFDWLKSGWLAEAAMQGFLEAPKHGTHNVEKIVFHRFGEAKKVRMILQY